MTTSTGRLLGEVSFPFCFHIGCFTSLRFIFTRISISLMNIKVKAYFFLYLSWYIMWNMFFKSWVLSTTRRRWWISPRRVDRCSEGGVRCWPRVFRQCGGCERVLCAAHYYENPSPAFAQPQRWFDWARIRRLGGFFVAQVSFPGALRSHASHGFGCHRSTFHLSSFHESVTIK